MAPLFRGMFDSGRRSKSVSHHERQLQAILSEFVASYDRDRPHRSLALRMPDFTARAQAGALGCRPILGGRHLATNGRRNQSQTFALLHPFGLVFGRLV